MGVSSSPASPGPGTHLVVSLSDSSSLLRIETPSRGDSDGDRFHVDQRPAGRTDAGTGVRAGRAGADGAGGRRGTRPAEGVQPDQARLHRGGQAGHRFLDAAQAVRRRRAVQRRLRDRRRGDLRGRRRLRDHHPGQRPGADAGLVLRHRGAEAAVHRHRDGRHHRRVHRRLRRQRATRLARRHRELRRPGRRRRRDGRDRGPRRRRLRDQRPQVLAVQRRGLGQPGREPEPGRGAHRPEGRGHQRAVGHHRRARHVGDQLHLDQHLGPAPRPQLRDRLRQRAECPQRTSSRAPAATATC